MISESEFLRLLSSVREFDHTIGPLTFRLRLPTETDIHSIYVENGLDEKTIERIAATFAIAARCVLGVTGATTADLGLPGEAQSLPNTAAVARELLADRRDIAETLQNEITRRYAERKAMLDTDRKN